MPVTTLHVTWKGPTPTSSVKATITLDTALVQLAPSELEIPISKIEDLSVTVEGAQAGDGVYAKTDFSTIIFYSRFPLDFSRELIGQTGGPDDLPFGAPGALGQAGDFNLKGVGTAPVGVKQFAMISNGGEDPVDLFEVVSIKP